MPGIIASVGDPEVNKTDKYLCLHRPSVLVDRPESHILHTTTHGKCRITLYTPSLEELGRHPQMKRKHCPIRHFQSKPQGFPYISSSPLPCSHGGTLTSRMRVNKKLKSKGYCVSGWWGEEPGNKTARSRGKNPELGKPALAVTNLLGDLGPVPRCQGISFPRGIMRRPGGWDSGSWGGEGGRWSPGGRAEVK